MVWLTLLILTVGALVGLTEFARALDRLFWGGVRPPPRPAPRVAIAVTEPAPETDPDDWGSDHVLTKDEVKAMKLRIRTMLKRWGAENSVVSFRRVSGRPILRAFLCKYILHDAHIVELHRDSDLALLCKTTHPGTELSVGRVECPFLIDSV